LGAGRREVSALLRFGRCDRRSRRRTRVYVVWGKTGRTSLKTCHRRRVHVQVEEVERKMSSVHHDTRKDAKQEGRRIKKERSLQRG